MCRYGNVCMGMYIWVYTYGCVRMNVNGMQKEIIKDFMVVCVHIYAKESYVYICMCIYVYA